jgi:acetyl-CoA C-acetyltransferase
MEDSIFKKEKHFMVIELNDVVAISAVRTPMGRFGGTIAHMPAYDIGAQVIASCLEKAGLEGNQIDDVIFGSCRQAGNGPNPARTASVRGGIPGEVPVVTINMACPSGMRCASMAAQQIQLGQSTTVMTGGMDSMSTIPYLLKNARWEGFKMGNKVLEDGWSDSIDPLIGQGMGDTAENLTEKYKIPREEQDQFAINSHQKAATAWEKGYFQNEVVPLKVPPRSRKDSESVFDKDETIRADTKIEKLAKLRPAFRKEGTVTAGNACQMSDGGAAILFTSREHARSLGVQPIFSIVSYSSVAVAPETMGEGPGIAIPEALKSAGMSMQDMSAIEVNEAFAVQVLTNQRMLNWDPEKLNMFGGAIALGHPTGISGSRIIVTLSNVLKTINKEIGVAAICGGGGVSMAMVIKMEN